MVLVFLIFSFKLALSLSFFTLTKRLFSSSLLSAIRVVSSTYLRLLMFLPHLDSSLWLIQTGISHDVLSIQVKQRGDSRPSTLHYTRTKFHCIHWSIISISNPAEKLAMNCWFIHKEIQTTVNIWKDAQSYLIREIQIKATERYHFLLSSLTKKFKTLTMQALVKVLRKTGSYILLLLSHFSCVRLCETP